MSADQPFVEVVGHVGGAPGQPASVPLRLRNDSDQTRVLVVTVLGLDSEWLPGPVRTVPLAPGAGLDLQLALLPAAGTPAGRYGFVVAVQPVDPVTGHSAGAVVQVESSLVVGDPAQVSLDIAPRDPRAVRSRRIDVHLDNRGTEPITVRLEPTASAGLTFSVRRREVALDPGGSERVRGRLTAQRRRWVGQDRRFPFILTAQGETTPIRLDGVFVAHPLLNRAVSRAVALVAVVAVWAAAALFAVTAISRHAHNSQTESASSQPAVPGGHGNGKGGGKAGAGGGGGGGGAGKGGGATSATNAGRLNGTVTGAAPAGVTVTLRPTSLVDSQPPKTSFVNVAYSPGAVGKLSSATMDLTAAATAPAPRRTTTSKEGSFAFADVPAPGYYLVTLAKRGYQSRSLIVSATPGKPLPDLKVPLVAGTGRLSGAVTGPGGRTLPSGARVTVTGGTLSLATHTATTGPGRGHWHIDGLSTPGTYVVSASADGFGTESAVVTLQASGKASRSLALHPGVEAIEGTVTFGSGQPLGGATVTATNGTITRTATTLTTGSPGFYSLADLPTGSRYTVTIKAAGFTTQTFRVSLDGNQNAATQDAVMTSSTAMLSGAVRDSKTGEPIDSAGLILAGDNGTYKIVSRAGTGEFTFDGVVPGDYTLTIEAFGYQADFRNVTLHAGDVSTLDAVSLVADDSGGVPSTSSITGHVVDAHTGAALQCPTVGGASCRIHVTVRPPQGQPALAPIVVGADQPYTVPGPDETDPAYAQGLPPGLYTLSFSFPGYERNTLAVAVPESTVVSAVPVALVPNGTIVGHITAPTTDLTGCVIAVPSDPTHPGTATPLPAGTNCATVPSAAASTDVTPCSVDPGVCLGQIDANGEYEIKFVPQGTYWLYIRTEKTGDPTHSLDPQFQGLTPVQVSVEAGQSRRYDAVLNQFGKVHVLLQHPSASGDPVIFGKALPVFLYNPQTSVMLPSVTAGGATGEADFLDVPNGTYVACASDPAPTTAVTSCPIGSLPAGADSGSTDQFQVNVNQSVTVPLVLSHGTGAVIGQVYSLDGATRHYVAGAKVTVNGVTGFAGQVPVRTPIEVTTDAKGCFAIAETTSVTFPSGCEGGSAPATRVTQGKFLVAPDTVTVDATVTTNDQRYGVQIVRNLQFTSSVDATGVVLTTPPTTFIGKVALNGIVNGATPDQVSLVATKLAPGAGNVVLHVKPDGTITWEDSSLSPDQQAANLAVPGDYELRASLDGYDVATVPVSIDLFATGTAADAKTDIGTITLDGHNSLSACAVDAQATPVPAVLDCSTHPVNGASFTLRSPNIVPVTVTAPPDENTVTFPDLSKAAGPYDIVVRAAGFPVTTVSNQAVDPADTTHDPIVIGLDQLGTLTGGVTGNLGDGHQFPLPGAKVSATDGTSTFTTTADADGNYTLTGTADKPGLVPSSSWTVTFSAFGYTDHVDTGVTVAPGTNTLGGALVAKKIATVQLTVTQDGSATGVNGASVKLTNAAIPGSPLPCTTADGVAGDDSTAGVCTFNDVAPVTYGVAISKAGFAPLNTTVTVRVGDPTVEQSFTFALASRTNAVNGTVTGLNLDGTTRTDWSTGPTLSVTLKGPAPDTTAQTGTVTAATGEFSFPGLADGSYQLTASAPTYGSFTQTVTVTGGQAAFVNIVLNAASGQVTVNVTSSIAGVSMSGATVALRAVDATAKDQSAQPAVVLTSGGPATTTFNQVPPGTYDIVVTGPAGQLGATLTGQTVVAGSQSIAVRIHEALLKVQVSSSHDSSTSPPTATLAIDPAGGATGTSFSTTVAADGSTTSVFVATPCNATNPTPTCSDATTVDYTATATLVAPTTVSDWTSSQETTTFANVADGSTPGTRTITFVQVTSLTVTVLASGGAPQTTGSVTVTLKGGGAGSAVTQTLDSTTGTATFSPLVAGSKYDISATDGASTPKTTTVRNVTMQPGHNDITLTLP